MIISSSTPLISVLMSVHNGNAYLSEAVESILAQSLSDFEFIIIDDGSTDGASDTLKAYAERDQRIRLYTQKNQGLTKSLNRGLRLSRGEFIARMDSDDISRPLRLETQFSYLRENPDVVCVGAEVELITDEGIRLGSRNHPQGHDAIRRSLLLGDGGALTHPVILFRRDAALKILGYDERFETAQDLDFYLRLSELGGIENIPQTLLDWRQHPHSVNRTKSSTWQAMKIMAIENTITRIGAASYAAQLFKTVRLSSFPSDRIQLAHYAFRNKRNREALILISSELRSGLRRLDAFKSLCRICFSSIHSFISK